MEKEKRSTLLKISNSWSIPIENSLPPIQIHLIEDA